MGCHFLLLGTFPTQELKPIILRLLHWQIGFLPLSLLGSPLDLIGSEISFRKSVRVCVFESNLDPSPPGCFLSTFSLHSAFSRLRKAGLTIMYHSRKSLMLVDGDFALEI